MTRQLDKGRCLNLTCAEHRARLEGLLAQCAQANDDLRRENETLREQIAQQKQRNAA